MVDRVDSGRHRLQPVRTIERLEVLPSTPHQPWLAEAEARAGDGRGPAVGACDRADRLTIVMEVRRSVGLLTAYCTTRYSRSQPVAERSAVLCSLASMTSTLFRPTGSCTACAASLPAPYSRSVSESDRQRIFRSCWRHATGTPPSLLGVMLLFTGRRNTVH